MAVYESLDDALNNRSLATHLELYGNELMPEDLSVSEDLALLQNLEKLEISLWNDVTLPESIKQLKKLNTLILDECNLQVYPREVFTCTSLVTLELCSSTERSLPMEIGHLRHLQNLTVWGVSYLPDTLALCQGLKELDLSHCNFPTLPRSIGDLPGLTHLDLSCTPVEELPRWLMEVPIEVLRWERGHPRIYKDRNYPKIQQIRQAWGAWESLQELYLGYQHIIDVSSHVRNWQKLHTLDLSDNEMNEYPEELCQLEALEELFLARNNISHLPDALERCQKLTTLNLFRNPIEHLPAVLFRMPNLREVNLAQTAIPEADWPHIVAELPHINFTFTVN